MKRTSAFAFVLVFLTATLLYAHYPGKIKITGAASEKQPAVTFDHAKHGDVLAKKCETCHHTNKGLTKAQTNTVQVKKCSECHLKAQGKMGTMADMSPTKNPLHVNCLRCHKEQKKGPVACTGCHKKA
jgi:hypothetical protein